MSMAIELKKAKGIREIKENIDLVSFYTNIK